MLAPAVVLLLALAVVLLAQEVLLPRALMILRGTQLDIRRGLAQCMRRVESMPAIVPPTPTIAGASQAQRVLFRATHVLALASLTPTYKPSTMSVATSQQKIAVRFHWIGKSCIL